MQHMMGLELLVSYTDINSKLITFHYSYQPMLVYNEPKLNPLILCDFMSQLPIPPLGVDLSHFDKLVQFCRY